MNGMKESILFTEFEKAGFETTLAVRRQFVRCYELLTEWNQKFNLTAITGFADVVLKHFIDSLYGMALLPRGASVADVGAGGGFPSLPLKLMRPDLRFTLLESSEKKTAFLNLAAGELGLSDCTAVPIRAEDAARGAYRESFDAVTARGVALLRVLAEYCLPLVRPGGLFIAYKGGACEEEYMQAFRAITLLGGKKEELREYELSDTGHKRTLAVIRKVAPTKPAYPRKPAAIKKQPL
jgi:16S rRNA (guanine(527)-N(7))-methyltransferase RsmG